MALAPGICTRFSAIMILLWFTRIGQAWAVFLDGTKERSRNGAERNCNGRRTEKDRHGRNPSVYRSNKGRNGTDQTVFNFFTEWTAMNGKGTEKAVHFRQISKFPFLSRPFRPFTVPFTVKPFIYRYFLAKSVPLPFLFIKNFPKQFILN